LLLLLLLTSARVLQVLEKMFLTIASRSTAREIDEIFHKIDPLQMGENFGQKSAFSAEHLASLKAAEASLREVGVRSGFAIVYYLLGMGGEVRVAMCCAVIAVQAVFAH